MNETRALAEFVSNIRYADLPREVIAKAKDLVLDSVGNMMAASSLPWSRIIFEYVRDWGSCAEESTVVGHGYRTKVENAVFANSSFAHGFEMDDMYLPGLSHPGCIVVPTVLAMGEARRVSGVDLIVALVAGYEVMGRINEAIAPSCSARGFHAATSVTGPFGAAAVAGKLLGFAPELMIHALSIAGSHAAGTMEYDQGGGSVKRMHAGMAAHGGLRSAFLAQKGLTGPPAILEGKRGIFRAFADAHSSDAITDGLGTEFRVVMGTNFKAYACCGAIHSGIDALGELVKEHEFAAAEIAAITLGTNRRSLPHISAPPADITGAQFNAPFCLALKAIRGTNGFRDYSEENLRDPDILALTRRVSLEVDEDVERGYPDRPGACVTVRLHTGKTMQKKMDYFKGHSRYPMTGSELEAKFRASASVAADAGKMQRLINLIQDLENQPDMSTLMRQLS